jgi:hypothetical protein
VEDAVGVDVYGDCCEHQQQQQQQQQQQHHLSVMPPWPGIVSAKSLILNALLNPPATAHVTHDINGFQVQMQLLLNCIENMKQSVCCGIFWALKVKSRPQKHWLQTAK